MSTKTSIVLAAAFALSTGARAQSLEEGIKMVKYERYESARKILAPMATTNAAANYYLGLAELGSGNVEAARADFAKYPTDLANIAGMARVAFETGNAAEGQRLAMSVADKAGKKDAQPLVYAADAINYGGGNAQQAIDLYKKALDKKLDNVDVRIGLGDAYLKQSTGGGEAMNNYENAVAKDAKNSLGYSRIGSLWYAARNYTSALDNYSKAKDADPTNPIPYRDLANAYFYSGKYALARQNIESYLQYSDKSCDDQIQYANILFLGKDYPAAITKLNEVVSTCQTKPYMYRLLGYSQYETKDYANSMQNMRTFFAKQDAKRIIPSDYLYMGKLYGQMKMADSAETFYAKAITADTAANKGKIYNDIAESYRAMNTEAGFKKSSEYYSKAVAANGDKATVLDYFWYGTMTYYAKDYANADKIFAEMETKFPNESSSTYWRGRVAAAQDSDGKTGAATQHYDKWLGVVGENYEKKTDLVGVYKYYALVNYNKGNKAAAKTYLDKITAISPDDAWAKQLQTSLAKAPAPAKGK